jgi:hypothetical protein
MPTPVRSQVRSCGICGGHSGTGADFLRVLRFSLPIIIPPTDPYTLYSLDTETASLNNQLKTCLVNHSFLVRMEVGSNTSTVSLRVVGGEENGTQCLEV